MWLVLNVRVSFILSIPPDSLIKRASKSSSLALSWRIGSSTVPEPFPPSIVMEIIFLISKSWGSTCTSTTLPDITGCISAFVLFAPDPDNSIFGGASKS